MELTCRMCDVRPVYTSLNFGQLLDSDVIFHFFNVSTIPINPPSLRLKGKGRALYLNVLRNQEALCRFCVGLHSLREVTSGWWLQSFGKKKPKLGRSIEEPVQNTQGQQFLHKPEIITENPMPLQADPSRELHFRRGTAISPKSIKLAPEKVLANKQP